MLGLGTLWRKPRSTVLFSKKSGMIWWIMPSIISVLPGRVPNLVVVALQYICCEEVASNILSLVELLFCLPMSNGHVERVFSQLKILKTERRNCLGEDQLDALLRMAAHAPPLSKWDASGAVQYWWNDKK